MVYPNWVYIAMHLTKDTEDKIKEYISANIPELKMNEDLHSTLAYSKKKREKMINRGNDRMKWKFKKFSKFWEDENSLVIELDSEDMKNRSKKLASDYELISDYDEYSPHITISYEGKEIDIESLPACDIDFEFEHEFIEDIDEELIDSDDEEIKWQETEEMEDEISEWFVM